MHSPFAEKFRVVVVTATLTSAAWIIAGSIWFDLRPGDPVPKPTPVKTPGVQETFASESGAPVDESVAISAPEEQEVAQLIIPVLDVSADELVDNFSDERGASGRLHEALDIMAPEGTSVVSAGPGTIERLFRSQVGGNTIYVRSNDGETIHYYAHLSEYAPGLNEGQKIRRGQRLGAVGSSGNADPDTPHLHFAILRTTPDAEWWEPATALNPYPMLVRE